jgi:hypothetical protein
MRLRKDRWAVWDGSDSEEYAEAPDSAKFFESEIKAIDAAHKMAEEIEKHGYLEYGIQAITAEEQTSALLSVINDAKRRLRALKKLGYQCPWYQ